MKKKLVSILVVGLLIAATFIFVPKEIIIKAEPGGGEEGSNEIGLNYEYLWEQINAVSRVVDNPLVYDENDIKKGRQFGSKGPTGISRNKFFRLVPF